ncbi:Small nuclear ribonucleoprotein-associated protein B [Botryosphaeria dothidea]
MAERNKQGKMINYRMRATLNDGRQMAGQMLAFDKKHMNLVLADTEEFRRVKRKSTKSQAPGAAAAPLIEAEEKRTLGLTIVRGCHIVSLSVEGPPPADPSARLGTSAPGGAAAPSLPAGPGISKPAGRGLPVGLTGPAAGVGGPGPGAFGGFPPQGGFPAGGAPPGFPGRGGPPPGAPGFQPPPGFNPGQGRGFPPGYGGR